ncbi:MAG: CHASE3 domain-containing protein [Panacibacter sp.]
MKLPIDKNFFLDRKIRSGYAIAFVLLLVCYILIFFTNKQLKEQADRVVHTYQAIGKLETLLSDLKDAETGVRGYIAIKDPIFLDPYRSSAKKMDLTFSDLRSLTLNSPLQRRRMDTLNRMIVKKLTILREGLNLFEKSGREMTDSLKAMSYKGKNTMDGIRDLIVRMQETERDNLKVSDESLTSFRSAINVINITSLLVAGLLIFYSIITYQRENVLKRKADEQALLYREELEEKIADLEMANNELVELRRNEKFAVTGRIARTIAHEVKNPLTNINLAAEQLKELTEPGEESNMLFDMINRNANRINHLVSDLLNSTKVAELKFDKVSINELLDEAMEMAKDRIELNNVKIEKNYTPDICDVSVDKEQIKIAFLNVIVNAIEATTPGEGKLIIKTDNKNGQCLITITDNGKGMKEEDLSKLFEPYFTSKRKGTGLGLTHTQSIILNHKGLIHVESKPGNGTKFEITLDFA